MVEELPLFISLIDPTALTKEIFFRRLKKIIPEDAYTWSHTYSATVPGAAVTIDLHCMMKFSRIHPFNVIIIILHVFIIRGI